MIFFADVFYRTSDCFLSMESASEIFSQQNMHMPHMQIPIVIMVVLASAAKYLMFVRLLSSKVLSDYVGILSQENRCVNRVFEKIVEKHKKFSKNREKTQNDRTVVNEILWQNDRNAGQRNCCFHCLLTGHSRLRSRPLGFEPCVRKKKKQILSYLLTLVDHQGFDRRLRIACRLPPQLP